MSPSIPSKPRWQLALSSTEQVNSCAISDDGSRIVAGTSQEFGSGQFAVVCLDAGGQQRWHRTVGGADAYQGVFWAAISADGSVAAAGGELAKTPGSGFLTAYDADDGTPLLSVFDLPGRVNQVSLCEHGTHLLACYAQTVALYRRTDANVFALLDRYSVAPGHSIESAMICGNGTRAVAGSIQYNDGSTGGGLVALDITDTGFANPTTTAFDAGLMRVAITPDGSAWGGCLHDASCVCFLNSADRPAWRHHSSVAASIAYAFAIAGSATGTVYLAYGVNLIVGDDPGAPQGAVFSIECNAIAASPSPVLRWVMPTQFAVNPGVSLDRAGRLISATDGKPDPGDETKEGAGNFYLFDNRADRVLWAYPTKLMNWPMQIAADARSVVGASDDGRVYYWSQDHSAEGGA